MNTALEPIETPLADYLAIAYPDSTRDVYDFLVQDVRDSHVSSHYHLSEIADGTDYSKSTVRRAIDNLENHVPLDYIWQGNAQHETKVRIVHSVPEPFNLDATTLTGFRVVG